MGVPLRNVKRTSCRILSARDLDRHAAQHKKEEAMEFSIDTDLDAGAHSPSTTARYLCACFCTPHSATTPILQLKPPSHAIPPPLPMTRPVDPHLQTCDLQKESKRPTQNGSRKNEGKGRKGEKTQGGASAERKRADATQRGPRDLARTETSNKALCCAGVDDAHEYTTRRPRCNHRTSSKYDRSAA